MVKVDLVVRESAYIGDGIFRGSVTVTVESDTRDYGNSVIKIISDILKDNVNFDSAKVIESPCA